MLQNPILEYNEKIQSGEIVTSKKVAKVYKYLVQIITDPESQWYYDADRAYDAIDFIECFCKHSKGKWARKPVFLELWQKAFIAAIFGVISKATGFRRFRKVLLVIGKKNGKSLIASTIALYMLVADGEGGAEIYSAATKRDQAKIVWKEAMRMVAQSPFLKKRVKCLSNVLEFKKTNSEFRTLSSDSGTEDGLNISCGICDETHAWKGSKGVDLSNIIEGGIDSRDEPLILKTTTAGFERDGVYDLDYEIAERIINGLFDPKGYKASEILPIIYELDSRDEWQDPASWIKANPNLGISKSIEYLAAKVEQAKEFARHLKNVLTKQFNIRETSDEVWLSFDDIDNDATFDIGELKPSYGIGGADLSKTTDLTAACVLFRVPNDDTIYVKSMAWLPSDLLEKRIKEDKIPYDFFMEQGWLRLSQGNKVDYDDVVAWFKEIQDECGCYIYEFGYDAWSASAFVKKMNDEFGDIGHAVSQLMKTLSDPMMQLGAEFQSKKVNYGNNQLLKWCLTNVRALVDKNGNIKPAKTTNQRQRIDSFAALLNAYVRFLEIKDEYLNIIKG